MIRQKNPEYGYTPDVPTTKVLPSKMNLEDNIYDRPSTPSPFDDAPSNRPDMGSWGGDIQPPSLGGTPPEPNIFED